MAAWDTNDLVTRCKRMAQRPEADEQTTAATWHEMLSEGQAYWMIMLATHVPEVNYGSPTKLTTADSGLTYDFPSFPLGHVELRKSPTGAVMIPGPEWDIGADYVPEGKKIRFPDGKTKTFADGPYARFVAEPGLIDANTAPVLLPETARQLLVARAVALWADRGGLRDPRPFLALEHKLWAGDPNVLGDMGYMGALKHQFLFAGTAAYPASGRWTQYISDGGGYVITR